MRVTLLYLVAFYGVLALFSVPYYSLHASETYTMGTIMTTATFRFNNENWFTMPHPKIVSFTMNDDGSAYGLTETGVLFTQTNVPNNLDIRIQRFEIQDHYHYIIEGNIAYSFEEFSAQLASAYAKHIST